jgi:hypothetical protein
MITGVLAVLLGEAARSRFLLWSSEFAQDRAAPGVVSLVSSEGDAVTQTDIRDQRGSGPRSEGEKICHIVERDDPDRALCGKDVTGYPWYPPWPMCVVCVDLDQQSRR